MFVKVSPKGSMRVTGNLDIAVPLSSFIIPSISPNRLKSDTKTSLAPDSVFIKLVCFNPPYSISIKNTVFSPRASKLYKPDSSVCVLDISEKEPISCTLKNTV